MGGDFVFEKYLKTTHNPEYKKVLGPHTNLIFIKFMKNGNKL